MFVPGSLWPRVEYVTRTAHHHGALVSIPTRLVSVDDRGLCFVVRVVEQLARKPSAGLGAGGAPPANPFLPFDPALYVADASPSHVCLLNKFNVADHHLLVVTREFQPQESVLDTKDFVAVAACMSECEAAGMETIAFYNGGRDAGASQPHKHLQIIPLRPSVDHQGLPIESWLAMDPLARRAGRIARLPLRHGIAFHDDDATASPATRGQRDELSYRRLLTAVELPAPGGPDRLLPAYNLLWTRRWMLLVPRRVECFDGISLNALAFAGALLVKDDDQLDALRRRGPLSALVYVTFAQAFR